MFDSTFNQSKHLVGLGTGILAVISNLKVITDDNSKVFIFTYCIQELAIHGIGVVQISRSSVHHFAFGDIKFHLP